MTGSGTTARLQVKVRGNVLCYDLIFGFCVYIYAERERDYRETVSDAIDGKEISAFCQ